MHLNRPAWPWTRRGIRWWLESRMRFAIRLRSARYSLTSAFGRGLQIGLPLTAVIVASVPIWGMSWYFDTENWAAGMWNSWAAARTDTWRAAMVRAVVHPAAPRSTDAAYDRRPVSPGPSRSRSSSSAIPGRATRASRC